MQYDQDGCPEGLRQQRPPRVIYYVDDVYQSIHTRKSDAERSADGSPIIEYVPRLMAKVRAKKTKRVRPRGE